jgi:hypothetical protein
MGQNPLSYYILYNESKHNILVVVDKANKTRHIMILQKKENPIVITY